MKLSAIADKVLSLIFPERCLFCGDIADDKYICAKCGSEYKRIALPVCSVCGLGRNECRCFSGLLFDRTVAPFYYEGRAREDILKFKYRGRHEYGRYFAHCISLTVNEQYSGICFDAVTSVPAIKNGSEDFFDHAGYLGRAVAKNIKAVFDGGLIEKTNERVKQHTLKFEQRFENVRGLYAGRGNAEYKSVLLIDDISTTGATFSECARVLKASGAEKVYCAAAAFTPHRVF